MYSSDCEADSYIVTEVKRLLLEGSPYVLVATQDGVLSDCVRGNDNAWTMTHVLLHKELLRVRGGCSNATVTMYTGRAGCGPGAGGADEKADGADVDWQGAAAGQPRGV